MLILHVSLPKRCTDPYHMYTTDIQKKGADLWYAYMMSLIHLQLNHVITIDCDR
jgi:hypothetical protein